MAVDTGRKTPKIRMYEGNEGDRFYTELLHQLEPDTTYHFRAVVEAVGPRSEEVGPGYGRDRSFTTAKEVVKRFTMRVANPPSGAVCWRAGCKWRPYPYMKHVAPLNYVWEWDGQNGTELPDTQVNFFVTAAGPEENGFYPTIQHDAFPFRLRAGKNYVWDFAAHEMREV